MGFLTSLWDEITTGAGCLAADLQYESAKSKARKEGIDVDTLESQLYGKMAENLPAPTIDLETLSEEDLQKINKLYKEIAKNGKKTSVETIDELQSLLNNIKSSLTDEDENKEEKPEQTEPVEAKPTTREERIGNVMAAFSQAPWHNESQPQQ